MDAQGIHVPNPQVHITHLAGCLLGVHVSAEFCGQRG